MIRQEIHENEIHIYDLTICKAPTQSTKKVTYKSLAKFNPFYHKRSNPNYIIQNNKTQTKITSNIILFLERQTLK